MEGTENWEQTFQTLKKYHDDAYKVIDEGIRLDAAGKREEAITCYEAGLSIIDKALSIRIECPPNPDLTWEKGCSMIQKMKKTKKEVLCRIADNQISQEESLTPNMPPSYEEAMAAASQSGNLSPIRTYEELGTALQNLKVETGAEDAHILFVHENVQIYFIGADGFVSDTREPETLRIVQMADPGVNKPRAYLEVGNWIYPLVPGVSPCLRTDYGAFILPDIHSTQEGAAVGLALPADAEASALEFLSDLLLGIVETPPPVRPEARSGRSRRDTSLSISRGIVKGAQMLSHGMVQGAYKAGQLMNYGTPKLMSRIQPEANPRYINPRVQTGLQVAKNVTAGAVTLTGYVASRVGGATMALGRFLAPHLQRQGTRLLAATTSLPEEKAASHVSGVLTLAAGAVEGVATVYDGLENAAKILGNSLATNTVKIVEHKYGAPAGAVTDDTLSAMGNVFVAGTYVRHLTPTGLAKTTAKQAGKAVVEDYRAVLHNKGGDNQQKPGPSD